MGLMRDSKKQLAINLIRCDIVKDVAVLKDVPIYSFQLIPFLTSVIIFCVLQPFKHVQIS